MYFYALISKPRSTLFSFRTAFGFYPLLSPHLLFSNYLFSPLQFATTHSQTDKRLRPTLRRGNFIVVFLSFLTFSLFIASDQGKTLAHLHAHLTYTLSSPISQFKHRIQTIGTCNQ
ncbi:hypothetical protein BX661DRAFT_29539 [Kickxella alabastrina]|uniref:uncharacterized protein n=1 Tax=Kickxella alabastrina TaxID=61397 RepID=UPI00221FFFFD|nr:uncharacterized protein BX661DRAFT_29539 [Kickxella alabastrina]KAI7826701.1 hypothetical protein BX661DRAFT_29539 [Kickxella alabastrina]